MSMNSLYDQFQRCLRHPHQRIVGVCSSCLQERLTSLIQPPSPPADQARRAYNLHPNSRTHVAHELQELNPHAKSHVVLPSTPGKARVGIADVLQDTRTQQQPPICIPSDSASTSKAITRGSHMTQQAKHHGHRPPSSESARGAGQKVYQNGHIDKQEYRRASSASPSLERKQRAAHEQNLQSENSFREGEKSKKSGGSWFSLSKSKSSSSSLSHGAYTQVDDRGVLKHPSKSPRGNAASMAGRSIDAHRHAVQGYGRPDLEAITETNTCDPKHISVRDSGTSTSWISVLFHRKKWSRSRSNLSNSSGGSVQNAISDTSGNDINSSDQNHRGPNSVEAGRLSWDGARPNLKQLILKRVEARSKPQVLRDASSSQQVDYAMKEYNDNGSREVSNHATHLQKSKSVASARSSISVEMPKDLMQSSFSPTLHQGQSNVMVGFEYDTYYDDRNLRRSRSWGRTWNRALSPLWGSRSHRHKVTIDPSASAHQHMQTPVTPSHVNLKSVPTPASTNAHLSPLRRSKLAPTLANLL